MNKSERFKKVFEYLRFNGVIKTQMDMANMMKASRTNISSALSGNTDILTPSFIERVAKTFCINYNWLLTGEGQMITPTNTATINGTNHGLISVGNGNTNTYNNNASPAVTEEAEEEVLPIIPRHLYEDTEVDVFEYVTENVVPTSPRIQQLPRYSMCYQVYSDELVPDIVPGDRLYIKPHSDVRKIIDGKPYVLETSTNGLMLRALYKGDTGVRASTKSQKYRDEYVPYEDIVRVYRILGLLRANI